MNTPTERARCALGPGSPSPATPVAGQSIPVTAPKGPPISAIAAQLLAAYPHGHDAQGVDRVPDQAATERAVRRVLRYDPGAGDQLVRAAKALDARTPGPGTAARRWVPGLLRWLADGAWRREAPAHEGERQRVYADAPAPWRAPEPPDPAADRALEEQRARLRESLSMLARKAAVT